MESHVAASSDRLIAGLDFKPSGTGSYVTAAKMVRFPCESANRFSPQSARLLRFKLATHGWINPETVRLGFDLKEIGGSNSVTLTTPSALGIFSRCRVIMAGQVVEDVDFLGRTATMMSKLKPPARVAMETVMNGMGASNASLVNESGTLQAIAQNEARTMIVPLDLLGIFNQHRYIPAGMIANGIVLEIELNSDPTYATTGSTQWVIENPVIFLTELTLDSQLQEQYVQRVLSGKALNMSGASVGVVL